VMQRRCQLLPYFLHARRQIAPPAMPLFRRYFLLPLFDAADISATHHFAFASPAAACPERLPMLPCQMSRCCQILPMIAAAEMSASAMAVWRAWPERHLPAEFTGQITVLSPPTVRCELPSSRRCRMTRLMAEADLRCQDAAGCRRMPDAALIADASQLRCRRVRARAIFQPATPMPRRLPLHDAPADGCPPIRHATRLTL